MRLTHSLLASAIFAGAFAFISPASTFDCAKASTKSEKAICADEALKAADAEMTATYDALMKRLTGDQPAMLRASQINWLKFREDSCGWNEDQAALTTCVMSVTKARTALFRGDVESGPGLSQPMTPWFFAQKQTKTACSADVSVYKFGANANTQAKKDFDARVDAFAAAMAKDYGTREATPDYEYDCYYSGFASINYASDDLVSVTMASEMYTGGAHGMNTATALNVDLKGDRILTFDDVFPASARKTLVDACTAEIRKEKVARFSDSGMDPDSLKEMLAGLDAEMKNYVEAINSAVGDFDRWFIHADRAEIYFPPYDVGSYAEGPYTCPLPKSMLALAAGVKGWIVP